MSDHLEGEPQGDGRAATADEVEDAAVNLDVRGGGPQVSAAREVVLARNTELHRARSAAGAAAERSATAAAVAQATTERVARARTEEDARQAKADADAAERDVERAAAALENADEAFQLATRKRVEFEREFGRIIERERTARGWTAEEAARRARVAPKTWQRLEDGLPVRNLTFSKVDILFRLKRGSIMQAWQEELDLNEVLKTGVPEETRQLLVESLQKGTPDHHGNDLLQSLRMDMSDKSRIMRTVVLLAQFIDDKRTVEALRGLTQLAFSGIINDWDIYDENDNLKMNIASQFSENDTVEPLEADDG